MSEASPILASRRGFFYVNIFSGGLRSVHVRRGGMSERWGGPRSVHVCRGGMSELTSITLV